MTTSYPLAYVGQPVTATFWNSAAAVAELMLNRPAGRLLQAVVQSIPDNTQTALTFTSEVLDTHNFHDTAVNTSRITPTVAGYYRFNGTYYTAAQTTAVATDASFRLNGATQVASGDRGVESGITNSKSADCLVEMDGVTDYIEFMALQDSAGAVNTTVSFRFTSLVEWIWMRPL